MSESSETAVTAETGRDGSGVPSALRAAVDVLSTAADVTLLAHVDPDADALGSALALGTALRRRGSTVRVSFSEPDRVPGALRELDADGLIVPADEVPAVPQTLVVLDTGSLQRVGRLADRVRAAVDAGNEVVVVDHHVDNPRYGTLHLLDETAEATALIVLRLIDALAAELDTSIAKCLYAGIVTDTRAFRHAGAHTHEVAARLLRTGLEPERLTRSLMDTRPFAWQRMLASVLREVRLEPEEARGLGLVHAVVRLADSDGLAIEDLDSVIDVVRTAKEAEVTAVLKETAPDRWSVSLRSDSRLDVGRAAAACGGGGHRLAAGCTAEGPAQEVLDSLREALAEAPLLP